MIVTVPEHKNGFFNAVLPKSNSPELIFVLTPGLVSSFSFPYLHILVPHLFLTLTHTHTAPGNAIGMKIWQCYDNLPAQQWYYTDDDRIALEGKGSLPFRFLFSNDFYVC